jgi:hypothetical protein
MVPAAFMNAAWAPQPYLSTALVGEFSRHLAQVEGCVPNDLDMLAIRVCQRLLPLVVKSYDCDRIS